MNIRLFSYIDQYDGIDCITLMFIYSVACLIYYKDVYVQWVYVH